MAATARDRAEADRDTAAAAGGRAEFSVAIITRGREDLKRAAEHRAAAARHRHLAAEDRQAAARDRAEAASDRGLARRDREMLANELARAGTDSLTGARGCCAGLAELELEIDRCRQENASLVVVYLDVVGLGHLNDTLGYSAGDALLRRVVSVCRAHLRAYDLIVRVGGDEFVCAQSNTSIANAQARFRTIAEALAGEPPACGLRTGFAALRDGETCGELVARADAELTPSRREDLRTQGGQIRPPKEM